MDEEAEVNRRVRRTTMTLAAAAGVIAVVVAVGLVRNRIPTVDIESAVASPPPGTVDGSPPQRASNGELLPGGWSPVPPPLDGLRGEVVVAGPGSGPALAAGRDVAIRTAGGWQVHADVLPGPPDVLAAVPADPVSWVLALGSGSATLLGPDPIAVETLEVPDGLRGGVVGAAWSDDGFVVVGTAARADDETPAYRLDPSTRTWTPLPGVPLAVNRPWNSAVVATADGAVVVMGAWLAGNNAPARPSLGAATLPSGSDAWQAVGGGGLSPQAADAAPVGGRVVVVDYEGNAAWMGDEGWTRPAPTGARAGECPPQLAVTGGAVLTIKCHQGLLLDTGTNTWQPIALPTSDGISLDGVVGFSGGFVAARVRLTVSDPEPHDLLALDPGAAWPMVRGREGRLAIPPGWAIAEELLTPNLGGPMELVTASTARMPAGGDTCAQVPEAAMEALGSDDALVSIQVRAGAHPPEGAPALGAIAELDGDWTDADLVDCAANADELIAYRTPVTWSGVFHYLLVVHHRDTPQPVVDEALTVANSLRTK